MKRLVTAAALVGALAGLVAVLVYRVATRPREFGWYAYSPLSTPRMPLFGLDPWWPGIVVAPLAAAVVAAAVAVVAVLAVRRGWLRTGR